MISIGIAIGSLFLFWLSFLSVIAYFIGFFRETQITKENAFSLRLIKDNNKPEESTEGSSAYYDSLMKTKVKSISQYKGISSGSPKASRNVSKSVSKRAVTSPQKSKSIKSKSEAKKSPSSESLGDDYYQTLMKKHQGKVKSISQYKGIGK